MRSRGRLFRLLEIASVGFPFCAYKLLHWPCAPGLAARVAIRLVARGVGSRRSRFERDRILPGGHRPSELAGGVHGPVGRLAGTARPGILAATRLVHRHDAVVRARGGDDRLRMARVPAACEPGRVERQRRRQCARRGSGPATADSVRGCRPIARRRDDLTVTIRVRRGLEFVGLGSRSFPVAAWRDARARGAGSSIRCDRSWFGRRSAIERWPTARSATPSRWAAGALPAASCRVAALLSPPERRGCSASYACPPRTALCAYGADHDRHA